MHIIGRLTADAKICTLKNERQVVNFSVAVNNNYKNKQSEKVKQTQYFDCAYWISMGVAKSLTKGTLVELSGRVSARAWVATNGEAQAALNFHVSQITFHDGGKKMETLQAAIKENNTQFATAETLEDLPF
jgi:single-strand DNA-binding protein